MFLELAKYIGIKEIQAAPMDLGSYNKYRGWTIPDNQDPDTMGYLVKYPDGYESWSPAEQFLEAYNELNDLDWPRALYLLKKGYKVTRAGWNGKGMFLFLVGGSQIQVNRPSLLGIYPDEVVPWLCSQTDALANDWEIIE